MTKAEQKALEAYQYGCHTFVESKREAYIKGYDQAEKDIIDKACKLFCEMTCRGYKDGKCFIGTCKDYRRFRKAMEDEK